MTKSGTKGSYWDPHCYEREHYPADPPSDTSVVPTPSESLFRGASAIPSPASPSFSSQKPPVNGLSRPDYIGASSPAPHAGCLFPYFRSDAPGPEGRFLPGKHSLGGKP